MDPPSIFRVRHRKGTTIPREGGGGGDTDTQQEETSTNRSNLGDDDDDNGHKENQNTRGGSSSSWWHGNSRRRRKVGTASPISEHRKQYLVVFLVCSSVVFCCWNFLMPPTTTTTMFPSVKVGGRQQQRPPTKSLGSQQQQRHLHHNHNYKKLLPLTVYAQNPNTDHHKLEKHVYAEMDIDCNKPYLHLPIHTDNDPYLPWIHDYFVAPATRSSTSSTSTTNSSSMYEVRFIAQNKRRCDTGHGKEQVMKYWEPQMALFQPVAIAVNTTTTNRYRLVDPNDYDDDDDDHHSKDDDDTLFIPETRFACRFHQNTKHESDDMITFSKYSFNYEYLNWRKRGNNKPMFERQGPDVKIFDYATLLFSCPIPPSAAAALHHTLSNSSSLWQLDLIPIRTRPRHDEGYLLTRHHVGPEEFKYLHRFNMTLHHGPKDSAQRIIPPFHQLGRIENLPLCLPSPSASVSSLAAAQQHDDTKKKKQYKLVACTWAAASYSRRGGKHVVTDTAARFMEWVAFHRLVGYEQIYVYDNTQMIASETTTTAATAVDLTTNHHPGNTQDPPSSSNDQQQQEQELPLKQVAQLFPGFVTYIPWPAKVCSNNFIGGRNPGERSSQYAAEASCRERFGPHTEWMSFMDIDEYLVPMPQQQLQQQNQQQQQPHGDVMANNNLISWVPLLDEMKRMSSQSSPVAVLGLRSSRSKPRVELMEESTDIKICSNALHGDGDQSEGESLSSSSSCLIPRRNESFLHVYNCDHVKWPRPFHFFQEMKQIFQPQFVLSHFVHYTVATREMTEYYHEKKKRNPNITFTRKLSTREKGLTYLNELTQGALIHARSVMPYETISREKACQLHSKDACPIGIVCPASTPYDDKLVDRNRFADPNNGKYCNCWINKHVEQELIPRLEQALKEHSLIYRRVK